MSCRIINSKPTFPWAFLGPTEWSGDRARWTFLADDRTGRRGAPRRWRTWRHLLESAEILGWSCCVWSRGGWRSPPRSPCPRSPTGSGGSWCRRSRPPWRRSRHRRAIRHRDSRSWRRCSGLGTGGSGCPAESPSRMDLQVASGDSLLESETNDPNVKTSWQFLLQVSTLAGKLYKHFSFPNSWSPMSSLLVSCAPLDLHLEQNIDQRCWSGYRWLRVLRGPCS